ncbi:MAG: tRNA (N(6)-L-threonylcarbamoyladenosine(37)-C(2))-methylthiotransferase MtaB [Anaerolineae bacterium]
MKVYLTFVGCKLNLAEIEELGRQLRGAGARLVEAPEEADLCVFNSCTVTATAAGKSRRKVRQLLRRAPTAQIMVTGCHATEAPGELRGLSPRVRVVDNEGKEGIATWVNAHMGARRQPAESASCGASEPPALRTRAFIKIQDGCNNACTYCVVRLARGPQRSRPPEAVLEDVRQRVREGYREVVLTGVHVGAYGQDLGTDLVFLLRELLAETGVQRLRLSSIEPHDLTPALLDLWEDPRLCPHLHLPLQSGCDATLRRMGRRYTAGEFGAQVAAAREAIPDLAVTTDVIVGFPGETDEEFAQTLRFVRGLGLARVHIFPFSPRPGTPAADMPNQVPLPVIRERCQALTAVALESGRQFVRRFLGREMDVLFEQCVGPARGDATWSGLTGNYLRVRATSREDLHNQVRRVRLLGVLDGNLVAGAIRAVAR